MHVGAMRRDSRGHTSIRLWLVCALSFALVGASQPPVPVLAEPTDAVGYQDFSYTSAVSAPTGDHPQSRLWFNDGSWWGGLFNPTDGSGNYNIYRFDGPTQSWITTGVRLDNRRPSSGDYLWDGTHLYVASAVAKPSTHTDRWDVRVYRYSYNATTKTYSQDFETILVKTSTESISIGKDSAGTFWVTFTSCSLTCTERPQDQAHPTQPRSVYVAHSTTSDAIWTRPYVLPVANTANLTADDISSLVMLSPQADVTKIGVMWTNQTPDVNGNTSFFFVVHLDGDPDSVWTVTSASQGPRQADDHMNLKSVQADASGVVYAVAKSSATGRADGPDAPLIVLLVMAADGGWQRHTVSRVVDNATRAIVLIDEEHRQLYVFVSAPCCSGGAIYVKQSSLDDISFPDGTGTPFIQSSIHTRISHPTSTKQNLNSTTGLLVLASDDSTRTYLHNTINLGAVPDTSIDAGPPGTVIRPDARFSFSTSEAGASFACSLDGAPFSPCVSPQRCTDLADGPHQFKVLAANAAGATDPTPAEANWTITSTSRDTMSRTQPAAQDCQKSPTGPTPPLRY